MREEGLDEMSGLPPPPLATLRVNLRLGWLRRTHEPAERRRFDVSRPHGGAAAPPAGGGRGRGRPGRPSDPRALFPNSSLGLVPEESVHGPEAR